MPQVSVAFVICVSSSSVVITTSVQVRVSALMAALDGATSHKLFTSPGTGRATVYLETSAKSVASMQ